MLSVGVELVPPSATEVPLGDRRRRPGASKPAQERRPLLKFAPRSAARSSVLSPESGISGSQNDAQHPIWCFYGHCHAEHRCWAVPGGVSLTRANRPCRGTRPSTQMCRPSCTRSRHCTHAGDCGRHPRGCCLLPPVISFLCPAPQFSVSLKYL